MSAVGTLVRICGVEDLESERGRAALLGQEQVALFLLADGSVLAVANHDPYSGANVISRGIVGSRGEAATVISPMHKQVFDLRTGVCLETHGAPRIDLRVYEVQVRDGDVFLAGEAAA